jgi:hypothetical protein
LNKGFATAHLKVRPYKAASDGLFPQPVKPFRVLCVPMQVRFDIRRLGFIIL